MARTYISFVSLVDTIGIEDATALCRAHGGRPCYIARTPEKCCALNGIISAVAVESLCAALGGEEYMLPLPPDRRVPIKVLVARLLEEGRTLSEAAREAGCSQRYVEMIRRDLKLPKPAPRPTTEVVIPSAPRPAKKYAVLELLVNNNEGLSVREIADRTGASESHVYCLRREFRIPPYRVRTSADSEA